MGRSQRGGWLYLNCNFWAVVKPSKAHDLSSPVQLFWFTLSVGWQRHLSTFHQAKAAKDMPSPAQVVASKLNFTPFSTSNPPPGPSLRSEAMARWWPGGIRQLVGTARSRSIWKMSSRSKPQMQLLLPSLQMPDFDWGFFCLFPWVNMG